VFSRKPDARNICPLMVACTSVSLRPTARVTQTDTIHKVANIYLSAVLILAIFYSEGCNHVPFVRHCLEPDVVCMIDRFY